MIWTTRPRSDLGHGLAGVVAGDGPPLLLIHGVGLRAEAWAAMVPMLTPTARVVAIDMPGHGGSAPVAAARLSDYVAAIAPLVRDLAARHGPVMVAGHSMGAMIALDLAVTLPQDVGGVAALNAVFKRPAEAAAAVRARAETLATTGAADPEPTLRRWFGNTQSAEANACRDWLTSATPEGYAMAYRTFANADGPSSDELATLQTPALFVTGADDPNSTPEMARQMARLAPNAQALVIDGAAHMAPMTHPAPIAAALLRGLAQLA